MPKQESTPNRVPFISRLDVLVGAMIGIAASAVSIAGEFGAAKNEEIALAITATGAIVSILMLLIYIGWLLYNDYNLRKASSETEEQKRQFELQIRELSVIRDNLQTGVKHLNMTSAKVASRFEELEEIDAKFHEEAIRVMTRVQLGKKPSELEIRVLKASYEALIKAICNTAVSTIGDSKQLENANFSANIKYIRPPSQGFEAKGPRYAVLERSDKSDQRRRDRDDDTTVNDYYMKGNLYYARMTDEGNDTPDYYLVEDISKTLSQMNDIYRGMFSEPSDLASEFYDCGLVTMIRGPEIEDIEDLNSQRVTTDKMILTYKKAHLLGFLCIDCKGKIGVFDTYYDLTVLNQLAAQAYKAMRTYYFVTSQTIKEGA